MDWEQRPNSTRSTTNPQSITIGYVLSGLLEPGLVRTYAAALTPAMMYSITAGRCTAATSRSKRRPSICTTST